MSKSIRFMTDTGFGRLVQDIKEKYPFLKTRSNRTNLQYLCVENLTVAYVNFSDKSITPSILAYKIFYEKNVRTKSLCIEGFEEVKTRKTLMRKLNNTKKILDEYEKV